MELRDALTQIAEIRQQMARGEVFRGYRAAMTAFSGMAAIITGFIQYSIFLMPRGSSLYCLGRCRCNLSDCRGH